MRAAYYEKNGPARDVLKLGEVETPRPGPGEVRIKLATSGVNPSDVKSRAGLTRKIAFPRVIPHSDGAGTIDQVGDGVPAGRVGERVWTWNAQWKRAFGTCAEHVVLPAALAVRLPDHIDFATGACLGIPAMTACHAVAVADAWAGSTLLIAGGAGAVGNYAIQFAKARGAVVITTARHGPDGKCENHERDDRLPRPDHVHPLLLHSEDQRSQRAKHQAPSRRGKSLGEARYWAICSPSFGPMPLTEAICVTELFRIRSTEPNVSSSASATRSDARPSQPSSSRPGPRAACGSSSSKRATASGPIPRTLFVPSFTVITRPSRSRSASRFAAHPPDAPDPTTMT